MLDLSCLIVSELSLPPNNQLNTLVITPQLTRDVSCHSTMIFGWTVFKVLLWLITICVSVPDARVISLKISCTISRYNELLCGSLSGESL